ARRDRLRVELLQVARHPLLGARDAARVERAHERLDRVERVRCGGGVELELLQRVVAGPAHLAGRAKRRTEEQAGTAVELAVGGVDAVREIAELAALLRLREARLHAGGDRLRRRREPRLRAREP